MYNRALIGKEICGQAVVIDEIEKKDMILDNKAIKIRYNHKSKHRTGRLCEAWVDKLITRETSESIKNENNQINIELIKLRLKDKFGIDYDLFFEDTIIKGKQLIGECDDTKPKIKKGKKPHFSEFSHSHGGQQVNLIGGDFAICYINLSGEPTTSWEKIK